MASFGDIGAAQARVLHGWIGHPLAMPANLVFAAGNHLSPSRYDLLGDAHFDATGRRAIDIGSGDDAFVGSGWHSAEREPGATFRWAAKDADVLVPSVGRGTVRIRVRIQPFVYAGSPSQTVRVELGGTPVGSATLVPGWQWVEFEPRATGGATTLAFHFDEARSPADTGLSADRRILCAAIDVIEIERVR